MEENTNLKHTQVPNGMGINNLDPKDQLIYAILHSHNNAKNECFPSLDCLSKESGASINTVRNSIKRLKDKGYIKTELRGRQTYYTFTNYEKFELFSPEFLKKDVSFLTKSYLVATQQYMYKDINGLGKISMPNTVLSKQINMPESTIRKCNAELASKDYLTIIKNENRDLQTGCKTETKIIELNKLGQAIIWTLCDHEDRIQKNTEDINELYKKLDAQQKLIDTLLKERDLNKAKEVESVKIKF